MRYLEKFAVPAFVGVAAWVLAGFWGEAGKDAWRYVTSRNQNAKTAWFDTGSEYVSAPASAVDSVSVPEGRPGYTDYDYVRRKR